jgi:hypothetical protein
MKRFIQGEDRSQVTLFPKCLDDIAEDNPVRVVDAFVEQLDLHGLGFGGMEPSETARCTLDGHQWAWHRDGWLQRADGGGYQAPPDRRA